MKGMFIFAQESGLTKEEVYNFAPWHYGPCSFELYDALDELKHKGLIVEEPPQASWGHFQITGLGREKAEEIRTEADSAALEYLKTVKAWTLSVSFHDLLRSVYQEYPYFASNTVLPHLR